MLKVRVPVGVIFGEQASVVQNLSRGEKKKNASEAFPSSSSDGKLYSSLLISERKKLLPRKEPPTDHSLVSKLVFVWGEEQKVKEEKEGKKEREKKEEMKQRNKDGAVINPP